VELYHYSFFRGSGLPIHQITQIKATQKREVIYSLLLMNAEIVQTPKKIRMQVNALLLAR